MADTIKTVNELRVKCTLRQGTEQTTRTLTVNNPKVYDTAQRERMIALRDKLTTGSLSGVVQPASWRDGDSVMEPYETAAVEFAYFESTEVFKDINEEPAPLVVTFNPADLNNLSTAENYLLGNLSVTVNVEGEGNYELQNVTAWSYSSQNLEQDEMTFKLSEGIGDSPTFTEGETSQYAIVTVTDVVTGRTGEATLSGVAFTPRVQINT